MPVAERSVGSVSESRAKPPPNSCWKRASKATSSAWKVVRNCVAMSVSSSKIRLLVRSDRRLQVQSLGFERVEPGLEGRVLVDGERIAGAELVEPEAAGGAPRPLEM